MALWAWPHFPRVVWEWPFPLGGPVGVASLSLGGGLGVAPPPLGGGVGVASLGGGQRMAPLWVVWVWPLPVGGGEGVASPSG